MSRVLVTGSTGLLGRTLVPLLVSADHDVTTTSRTSSSSSSHRAVDLCDAAAVAMLLEVVQPDVVVHLAGGTAPTRTGLVDANVRATSGLLAGLSSAGVLLRRLIVTGSAAEYGDVTGGPVREDAPLMPVTPYGQAKVAQTWLVRLLGPEVAESVVVARPFNVVSAALPTSSPLGNLRWQLQDPQVTTVRCGRLDVQRDFVSANLVAEALAALVTAADPPQVLNVCSGRAVILGDLFAEVVRQASAGVRLVPDPALVGLPAADAVVGDAERLKDLGTWRHESLTDLASAVLGRPAE